MNETPKQTAYAFNKDNIEQLNSFLKGELSAIETYQQTIDKMDPEDTQALTVLRTCKQSHETRAERLRREVVALGGTPATDSGAWGTFAKLAEGTAKLFGKKAAVAMLEEGEDHGLRDYRRDLDELDGAVRTFVEREILPAQKQTHDSLNRLQASL